MLTISAPSEMYTGGTGTDTFSNRLDMYGMKPAELSGVSKYLTLLTPNNPEGEIK